MRSVPYLYKWGGGWGEGEEEEEREIKTHSLQRARLSMPRDGQDGKMDKGPPSWEHMTDYILEGQGTHPIRWWRNLSQCGTQNRGAIIKRSKSISFWGLGLGGLSSEQHGNGKRIGR